MIRALVEHYKNTSVQRNLQYPLIVTQEEHTWRITKDDVVELVSCNHIEADTRLILEASKSYFPVVINATDTDILVLMAYACAKKNIEQNWLMQIEIITYVNMKSIRGYYGDKFCSVFLAYHSITGCDTTSYPTNIGKIRPLSKMVKNRVMHLLYELGSSENSFKNVTSAIKFYYTITITVTCVQMYENQQVKSSVNLISDFSSVKNHVLRADLQTFVWKQCMVQNMIVPSLDGRGWCERDGKILPVWYDIPQFPPSLPRYPKKKQTGQAKKSSMTVPPCKKSKD